MDSVPIKLNLISESSILTVTDNELYGFGFNNSYQLGLGHQKNQKTPQKILFDHDVIMISCGYGTTAIIALELKD